MFIITTEEIKWDAPADAGLPQEVRLEVSSEDEIADKLSDLYGWLVLQVFYNTEPEESHTPEALEDRRWERPQYYGGFSPDGDFVILSRYRDSNPLDESNWAVACETLKAKPFDGEFDADPETLPAVYHWRAGSDLTGWVEYLMVSRYAPDAVKDAAGELVAALEGYPVLDDMDFSRREQEAADSLWEGLSIRERIDYCRQAGVSIFASRRDDVSGELSYVLNGY